MGKAEIPGGSFSKSTKKIDSAVLLCYNEPEGIFYEFERL